MPYYAVVHSPIQIRLLLPVAGLMFTMGLLAGGYVWFLWEIIEQISFLGMEGFASLNESIYFRGAVTLFNCLILMFVACFLFCELATGSWVRSTACRGNCSG